MPDFGDNNRRDGGRYQGNNNYRGHQRGGDQRYRRDDDDGGGQHGGTLRDQVARWMHDDRTTNDAKLMAAVTIQQNILLKKIMMQLSDIANVICAMPDASSGKPQSPSVVNKPQPRHDNADQDDGDVLSEDDGNDSQEK